MLSFVVLLALISSANPQEGKPPQVQGVTLTRAVQDSSPALGVSWNAVSGSGITYIVCYSTHSNSGTASAPPANANCDMRGITGTTTTLSPLNSATNHYIWVAAVSQGGQGPYSNRQFSRTYQVPSAVSRPTVTQTVGEPVLTVSWTNPPSELAITRYEVQYRVTGSGDSGWKTVRVTGPNPSPTTLSSLVGGTIYEIRVRAVSAVGVGLYSSTISQIVARVPSQVTGLSVTQTAVSGRPALRVSWDEPQSDATITSYEVQYRSGNPGSWTTVKVPGASSITITVTLLTVDRSYDVRVRAVSSAGNGAYSRVQTQFLNRVPMIIAAPTVTQTAESGRPALSVSWTKPQSPLPILRYDVRYRVSSAIRWTTVPVTGSTTTTLTNVVPGRRYDVQVRAVSQSGNGGYSAATTQMLNTVPSAVGIPSVAQAVTSGSPTFAVSWTRPQSDLPITGYDIRHRVSSTGSWTTVMRVGGSTTMTTLPPLVAGRRYDVQVRAISSVGNGPYSVSRTQTAGTVPSAIGTPSVTQTAVLGRPALRVSWSRPQSDLPITGYDIRHRVSSTGSWTTVRVTGSTTMTALETLTPGRSYDVQVRAVSAAGTGAYSNSKKQDLNRVPSAVDAPSVSQTVVTGRPALIVSWTKPLSELTITRYDVQYKQSGTTGWSTVPVSGSDTLSTTLERLSVGTSYDVQVRAVSVVGNGQYSGVVRKTTYRAPEVVTSVNLNFDDKNTEVTLTVTWSSPSSDVDIIHYKVQYWEDRMPVETLQIDGLQTSISLVRERTYRLRVRAVSDIGEGQWSRTYTIGPPTTPTITEITPSSTTISLAWNDDGFNYRLYVQKRDSAMTTTPGPLSPPYNITGLESNTQYTVVVEAYNPLGSANARRTVRTLPEAVKDLNLQVLSSTAIKVSWTPPPNADRLPLTYHVSYSSEFTSSTSRPTTEQSLDLTGLHPFDVYNVSVEARNSRGRSGAVMSNARTMSAAPSVSPVNFSPSSNMINSRNITIKWGIPLRGGRNGIITQYIVRWFVLINSQYRILWNFTVSVASPTFTTPSMLTHTVTGLTPSTYYGWQIAAVNDAGIGGFSNRQGGWTKEDVPGPVSSLNYTVTSETAAKITWSVPEEPNGFIRGYDVVYGVYMRSEGQKSQLTGSSGRTLDITGLTPETPIHVSVRAKTSVGSGEPSTIIFFTKEGFPTVEPRNVTVDWVNPTSLRVSWTSLSLHEARGWPVYTVFVVSASQRTARAVQPVTTMNSSVVVDNLDPASSYCVNVQVETGAGTNPSLRTAPVMRTCIDPTTETVPPSHAGIIAGVLVVLIVLVIGIVILVVVILFMYRSRKQSAKSFSPSESENEIAAKGGKSRNVPLKSLSVASEDYGSMGDIQSKGGQASNVYEIANTSLGAPVSKADFPAHVLMMHKERDSGFEKEYLSITNDPNGVEDIAKANRVKNRYLNIHTYDHSRVVLSVTDESGNDYINASYIDGYRRENAYIASQGPTPSTVGDFWQMILDHKAPVIVMLTKVEEKGRKKCEKYWEEELNKTVEKGRGIEITTVKFKPYADYEVRDILVVNTTDPSSKPLRVKHFLYTGWPDHGVPQHPASLVKFAQKVRRAYQHNTSPLLVHCSAGVGRTGTFITIDAMMQRAKEKDDLNVYEFVTEMRTKRTYMVQNQDQYVFIHDALCDYITCGDTSIAAHELLRTISEMEKTDQQTNKSGFVQQFEFLERLSKSPCPEDHKFAKKHTIAKKNRYKDRFPYSTSHMHVPGKSPNNGADYINASFVDSYSAKNAFIAAQSPMMSTLFDFWELLWQFKPPTVVVLCNWVENKQESCIEFWPSEKQCGADYGIVRVNHKSVTQYDGFDKYQFEVIDKRKDNCIPYYLTLFHFKEWLADGTPPVPSLLNMMGEAEKAHQGVTKPLLVTCNDGMARTGVFITAMCEVERVKAEGEVDLFQTIKAARSKRPYMVSTPEQYKLCFNILQAYLDSFDTYANFKVV